MTTEVGDTVGSPIIGSGLATPPARLLVLAGGSSAIVNLPAFLATARAALGCEVRLMLTNAAAAFIPSGTLELFCDAVLASSRDLSLGNHVSHAEWADCLVAYPATANLLGNMANGLAPDHVTAAFLAFEGSTTLFPCMSPSMWHHPAVQRNVRRLDADGHLVVRPRAAQAYSAARKGFSDAFALASPAEACQLILRHHKESNA